MNDFIDGLGKVSKPPSPFLKKGSQGLKTPIGYYGGKQRMIKYILPLIPQHKLYCEPFFGGGAVFWAKPPSEVEVINDLKDNVVVFYRVLKNDYARLKKKIDTTLHSRSLYKQAMQIFKCPKEHSELDRAWALWTLATEGFAHTLSSWGHDKGGKVERQVDNARKRMSAIYSERLEKTQIESNDALRVIQLRDQKETFFYLDPPYFNSECADYKGYTEQDFENLLKACEKMKGKFLLSSYPSKVLNKYAKKNGWKQRKIEVAVRVTKLTDKTKTEVLTYNYEPPKHAIGTGLNAPGGLHPVFMLARVMEMVFSIL